MNYTTGRVITIITCLIFIAVTSIMINPALLLLLIVMDYKLEPTIEKRN